MKILISILLAILPALALATPSGPTPTCPTTATYTTTVGASAVGTWTAPTTDSNGNPLPTGTTLTYTVYSIANGTATAVVSGLTATTYTFANLTLGSACYAVTATDSNGESGYSNAVLLQANYPPAAPAAPSSFTISAPAAASLKLGLPKG